MRNRTCGLGWLGCWAWVGLVLPTCLAQEPPPPATPAVQTVPAAAVPTNQQLQAWVDQLADPDYGQREQAQRRLAQWATLARPFLELVDAKKNTEQYLRSQRILRELERIDLWQPILVSRQQQNADIWELVRWLSATTDNPINFSRSTKLNRGTVSVDWQNRTFFEALDELSAAGELVQHFWDDRDRQGLLLLPGFPGKPPTAYQGPLRLRIHQIDREAHANIHFLRDETDRDENLFLEAVLHWEQRLLLSKVGANPRLSLARTDTGEKLEQVAGSALRGWLPMYRRNRQIVYTVLIEPPRQPAQRIAELRLSLELEAVGQMTILSLPLQPEAPQSTDSNLASPAPRVAAHATPDGVPQAWHQQSQDGYQVELRTVQTEQTANGPVTNVRIAIRRVEPNDRLNDSQRMDEFIIVYDQMDRPLQYNQQQVLSSDNGFAIQYLLNVPHTPNPPARLEVHAAQLRSQRQFEFVFHDIPLPPLLSP